jgi:addiction module HigA family antidote
MATLDSHRPGRLIRSICLHAFGVTVTEGARCLGITRQALNNVVNRRTVISPGMAIRLDKAFGGGAEGWLSRHISYDLPQARSKADQILLQSASGRIPSVALEGVFR